MTKDTDGNGVADQFGVTGYTWKEAFESNGVNLFNQTGTECSFTGKRVGEALTFLEKLKNLEDGSSNISMEQIIWNRKLNKNLKNQ